MNEGDLLTVSSHLLISESVHFEGSRNLSFVVVIEGGRGKEMLKIREGYLL